ncbi:MAG: FAD:protein FMN transferase [Comamonadaceae bacterium]|nr:FAD:protein FMN transferase [Comamonadaceae bacterium]
MRRRQAVGLLSLLPLTAALGLTGCAREQPFQQLEGATMGTRYHIRFQPPSHSFDVAALQAAVEARLEALNASLSTYRADSLITAFNEAPVGQAMPIDADFEHMLTLSRQVHKASSGAFDPTVGGLVNLWGFGWPKPEQPLTRLPEPDAIEAARARFDAVEQPSPGQLLKHAPLRLDFSAIAKGYGVDLIAEVVRSQGVQHFMTEIGGEVATQGKGPTGGPWRIGIEAPDPAVTGRLLTRVHLTDGALATSGNYRNFFEVEGRRFSHVIDPVSGYPVPQPPVSVSVIAPSVALADAWATAFMVLDEERGVQVAEENQLAVYWVYQDNGGHRARQSSRMQPYLDTAKH